MPVSIDTFKQRRENQRTVFFDHLVPQIDYLTNNLQEALNTLNAQRPKDTPRIRQFETMISALKTVAHSSESIFTTNSRLENALTRLGELPSFLEADGGKNFQLLQDTVDAHPELKTPCRRRIRTSA